MQNYSVMHWSSLLGKGDEVLNVARPLAPTMKYPGSLKHFPECRSALWPVRDGLMAAGGFQGELICKYLNQPGGAFATKISNGENAITNAVDISYSPTEVPEICASVAFLMFNYLKALLNITRSFLS